MMTRLWPASILLTLFFSAGSALADKSCSYSGVSISSAGIIKVTCDVTKPDTTPPIATLHGTSSDSCTYTGSTSTPAISITGSSGLVHAWCAGTSTSSNASFTIRAEKSFATVGDPLTFTVTRNKGSGSLGADTLTLSTVSGSTADANFNPTSASFGANEGDGASRTARAIFTKAGLATLSATSSGNTVNPSGQITVSRADTGASCAGIPVPPYAADGGVASANMGDHRLIAASASVRAAGAIRFTSPASGSRTFSVGAPAPNAVGYPPLSSLDMTVSSCPGDFSPSNNACKIPGSNGKGVKITVGSSDCPVSASGTYYLNVRSVTPGRDVGFLLSAQ